VGEPEELAALWHPDDPTGIAVHLNTFDAVVCSLRNAAVEKLGPELAGQTLLAEIAPMPFGERQARMVMTYVEGNQSIANFAHVPVPPLVVQRLRARLRRVGKVRVPPPPTDSE
jgi:hypothetical protein